MRINQFISAVQIIRENIVFKMQKLFTLILFVGILVAICIAAGPEMSEAKVKIANECKEQEKATDADVQGFLTRKTPDTPTSKCLTACVFEKMGTIKDGKIDGAAMKASMARDFGSGEKSPYDEVIDECQKIMNADRCEMAAQFLACMKKGFAAHGDPKSN